MINPGDIITVQALHADGQWYRRWQTTVESIDGICIVTYSPPGSSVEDIGRGQRTHARAVRSGNPMVSDLHTFLMQFFLTLCKARWYYLCRYVSTH